MRPGAVQRSSGGPFSFRLLRSYCCILSAKWELVGMRMVKLGELQVSVVGLGCNNFGRLGPGLEVGDILLPLGRLGGDSGVEGGGDEPMPRSDVQLPPGCTRPVS